MIDKQPLRGAFDYLLESISAQRSKPTADIPPSFPPPPEITERRTAKRDMSVTGAIISRIWLALLAWRA
jgi:hypothetical protein